MSFLLPQEQTMTMYFEGYDKAREAVSKMDEADLLAQIDGLFGRDNLPENYTLEDLRIEAQEQTRRDFTDTSSKEFELVEFYTKLSKAMKLGAL
jgi:hypothetical protein